METCSYYPNMTHSSPRALAMLLALVSALVLSPLYMDHRRSEGGLLDRQWNFGGLVLPVLVGGLIVAIRTTYSCSSKNNHKVVSGEFQSRDCYAEDGCMLKIGSSSWGLAGILVLLLFVISWQDSVQHLFWR